MINFARKIEKLNKFLLKAVIKAIEAGTKIINLYTGASDEIDKLKQLIGKLTEIKKRIGSRKMITWYEDDELKIEFDKTPVVAMSYPMPCYSDEKNRKIDEKPFLNKADLTVKITYSGKEYFFTIPKGYTWDGATIPRFFWRLMGANTSPDFLIPSMIHDVLCENHNYINNDRYLSTIVLERLLYCSNVNFFKRWIMKHCVDNFQKFQGWKQQECKS